MLHMSYQPSHLEYKDWGQPPSCVFILLYTPQNVISSSTSAQFHRPEKIRRGAPNMIEWFLKYFKGSQPAGSRVAVGFGHLEGFGIPSRISLGIATR
jgi:hypothetical protein